MQSIPSNGVSALDHLVNVRISTNRLWGVKGNKPGAAMLTGLRNLSASGRAPKYLRPYLGGAKGTALYKAAKDDSDDSMFC